MIDNNIKYNLDSINLNDFLKKSYENLVKSIEKEGYVLEYQNFDELYEIFHENNVVGFIAVEKSILPNTKVITDCYVLPEARGNKLLYDALIDLISNTRYKFLIKKPTRSMIHALISYGLAYKITDELVASWLDFDVALNEVYKNSKIKRLYKKVTSENENIMYKADFFDLNHNCALFHDKLNIVSKDPDTLVMIEPRKYDIKKYNLRKKLKKVSVNYLEDINFEWEVSYDDIIEFFDDLNRELSSKFTVDNIVGSEDELKSEAVELLEENSLSVEDGFKIRQSIIDAIDDEEMLSTFINYRFEFLTQNPRYIGKKIDGDEKLFGCPFCNNPLKGGFYVCDGCGHQFENVLAPDEIEGFNISNDFDLFDEDFTPEDLLSPDFMLQFDDFNKKLADFFGDDYEQFKESLIAGDLSSANELFENKPDMTNLDWNFVDDNKIDNGTLKLINERGYDEDEVYKVQSKISLFEFLKHADENITTWKLNSINITNHVNFDTIEYALNNEYIRKIKGIEFFNHLNSFSLEELQKESEFLYGSSSDNKGEIINRLINDGDFSYAITEKGKQYLNDNPLMNYFAEYMQDYFFYEFQKYYDNYKDDLTIDEIAKKYINEDFKYSFKKGDFEVYLRYLEFYFKYNWFNEEYEEALVFLTQRVIYELSKWYSDESNRSFELAISFKTVELSNIVFSSNVEFDIEEIFKRSYKEFKFPHMKWDKKTLLEDIKNLYESQDFMIINRECIMEFISPGDE